MPLTPRVRGTAKVTVDFIDVTTHDVTYTIDFPVDDISRPRLTRQIRAMALAVETSGVTIRLAGPALADTLADLRELGRDLQTEALARGEDLAVEVDGSPEPPRQVLRLVDHL